MEVCKSRVFACGGAVPDSVRPCSRRKQGAVVRVDTCGGGAQDRVHACHTLNQCICKTGAEETRVEGAAGSRGRACRTNVCPPKLDSFTECRPCMCTAAAVRS